ncbi:hypothetical protein SynSYN20_01757 [Synechococcus sp. SYN20]|uniref:hypothetical protein n=1 Tax=Synechococcus sp. SYN20 TaxID=1050714 RepID=UPI001645CC14|nr:hypothetical protein [Synechococcus sp. SYN20]QNJ26083.1 hypothetical protein SynSYN20_01757 [Synechococcus sp. SYN20]
MNYQRYQRDPRELISQRKALLQAVTVLWENDHQELAQRLWDVGYQLKPEACCCSGEYLRDA